MRIVIILILMILADAGATCIADGLVGHRNAWIDGAVVGGVSVLVIASINLLSRKKG